MLLAKQNFLCQYVSIGKHLCRAQNNVASAPADPVSDGASYRVAGMWLTDEEFASLVRDLVEVFQPRLANAPGKGRRRRLLYTVTLPDPRVTG